MGKRGNYLRKILAAGAFAVLGVLGFGGCKTAQKTKEPKQERPEIPQMDSIRPPYGEAIAMYGTPYRGYEMKDAVRELSKTIEEQVK